MNKRAVSPLIATVLLMAFAVALGAIVMTWGKNYVTDTTHNAENDNGIKCAFDVAGEVIGTEGSAKACYDQVAHTLSFIFKNNAYEEFSGLKVTLFDDQNNIDSPAVLLPDSISQGEIKKVVTAPTTELASTMITQVIISPVISSEGEEITCVDTVKPITEIETRTGC